jgi:16S rRNA (guanine527-N7)-methyltransferase
MIDEHIKILKKYLIENKLPYNPEIIDKFKIYIELLKLSPHNVTAIKNVNEIIIKHFIDSISLALFYKKFEENIKILDIGTGCFMS